MAIELTKVKNQAMLNGLVEICKQKEEPVEIHWRGIQLSDIKPEIDKTDDHDYPFKDRKGRRVSLDRQAKMAFFDIENEKLAVVRKANLMFNQSTAWGNGLIKLTEEGDVEGVSIIVLAPDIMPEVPANDEDCEVMDFEHHRIWGWNIDEDQEYIRQAIDDIFKNSNVIVQLPPEGLRHHFKIGKRK